MSEGGRRQLGKRLPSLAVAVLLPWAFASGCDAGADAKTAPSGSARPQSPPQGQPPAPLMPANPIGLGTRGAQVDPDAQKRFRVELCFLGAVGLEVARQAYWDSLGAEDPSPMHLPSFGSYPEHERRRGKDGKPSLAEKLGRLPFDGHLRACTAAKSQKEPAYPELDESLVRFEAFVAPAARALAEASRYYARDEYRRDQFDKGRELHTRLSDLLGGLEQAVADFRPAFERWLQVPAAASVDAGSTAGPRRPAAVALALSLALLASPRDEGREQATLAKAEATAATQRGDAAAAKLLPLLEIARQLHAAQGRLSPSQRYRLAAAAIEVLEAQYRAALRSARGDGDDDSFGRPPRLSPSLRSPPQIPPPRR